MAMTRDRMEGPPEMGRASRKERASCFSFAPRVQRAAFGAAGGLGPARRGDMLRAFRGGWTTFMRALEGNEMIVDGGGSASPR